MAVLGRTLFGHFSRQVLHHSKQLCEPRAFHGCLHRPLPRRPEWREIDVSGDRILHVGAIRRDRHRTASRRNDADIEELSPIIAEARPCDDVAFTGIDDHEAASRHRLAPRQLTVERQTREPAIAQQ